MVILKIFYHAVLKMTQRCPNQGVLKKLNQLDIIRKASTTYPLQEKQKCVLGNSIFL